MTDAAMIAVLRAARAEVDKQEALIHAEMEERTSNFRMWTYGQCAAWPAYETALAELDRQRAEFGT
jgi:hypothetical protein